MFIVYGDLLNIVVVSHDSFWPLRGGGGLRVYWIVKKLIEKKHNITVFAPFIDMQGVEKEFPGVKFVNLGNITRFSKNKEFLYLKIGFRILKNLFKQKPDVIYAHNIVSAFPAFVYSKLTGVPLVYDIDDFTMGLSKNKILEKYGPLLECFTAKYSSKVIAAYTELKIQLEKRNVRNISIVRHGVDLDIFKPSKNKRKDLVVYMGGVESHDGTLLIPPAAKIVLEKYPKMKFMIIGDGSDFLTLKNLAKKYKVEKNFIFKGWTNHKKIPALIKDSKVGLVTHLRSLATEICLPLKGYEYMAMKIPFLVPDLKGMKRESGDTGTSLIFRTGNSSDLAQKILFLLDNPKFGKNMAIKGRDFVVKNCSWPKNALEIVKICEQNSR